MAEVQLPVGLSRRPARWSDAANIADLLIACEEHGDVVEVELSDVLAEWQRPGVDLATMTTLVFDGQRPVAFAMVIDGRADVAVAPQHRGRGIGTALLSFIRDVARREGREVVEQVLPDDRSDAAALLAAHGAEPVRTSWRLQVAVTDVVRPQVPPPYRIADLTDGTRARAVHEVIEAAFSEWPGRQGTPFDEWAAEVWRHECLVAAASPIVLCDDRVVGVAVCLDYDREAWVHQLAVAAPHRGHGLARALLTEVMWRARHRDQTAIGVSTDSRTGVLTLYEHMGMRVRRTYTRWSLPVDAR